MEKDQDGSSSELDPTKLTHINLFFQLPIFTKDLLKKIKSRSDSKKALVYLYWQKQEYISVNSPSIKPWSTEDEYSYILIDEISLNDDNMRDFDVIYPNFVRGISEGLPTENIKDNHEFCDLYKTFIVHYKGTYTIEQ